MVIVSNMFKKLFLACSALGMCFYLLGCASKIGSDVVIKNTQKKIVPQWASDTLITCIQLYPANTVLSVALIIGGNPIFCGLRKEGDTIHLEENKNQVFEIGSISKVLTTTMLAYEVEMGHLSLSDSINSYFSFPFHQNTFLSFLSLANHTSGLARLPSNFWLSALFHPSNPYKQYDSKKLEDYLKNSLSLEHPSGTKSAYSNLGMGVLAYTLSIKNQQSYEQMLQQRLVQQYGLHHTTSDKKKIESLLVKGLNQKGQVTSNWDPGALVGCGGVFSNVEDLSIFAKAHFNLADRVLSLTRTKTFQESNKRSVALGWFIIHQPGYDWYWHNGGTGGYSSSMVINPETGNGVVILSNVSAYHKKSDEIDHACFKLMRNLEWGEK